MFIEIIDLEIEIQKIRNVRFIPFFFKLKYIEFQHNRIVKSLKNYLRVNYLNYENVKDFFDLYDNTLDSVKMFMPYNTFPERIGSRVFINNSIYFTLITKDLRYDIEFNKNGMIEINEWEDIRTLSNGKNNMKRTFNNQYTINDIKVRMALNELIVGYVEKYLKSYIFNKKEK